MSKSNAENATESATGNIAENAAGSTPERATSNPAPLNDDDYIDLIAEWMSTLRLMLEHGEGYQDVNRGEGLALLILDRSKAGLSAGMLSEAMHLTTGRMANILKQLEAKGYIERSHDPQNRRRTVITLTEAGGEHVGELYEEAKSRAAVVLRKLGREDTEELIRIFRKLADMGKES